MAMIPKKRKRKHSELDKEVSSKYPEVPLDQLQMTVLRKYKKFFKIQTPQCTHKPQLAEVVLTHFKDIPVCQKEVIAFFIYMVKMNLNSLDQKETNVSNTNSLQPSTSINDSKPHIFRKL